MSDVLPDKLSRALRLSDRGAYAEQRLFVLSPFGTFATALLVFVLLAGLLALAFSLSGVSPLVTAGGKTAIRSEALLGLWFCLMNATVLGMQRFSRVRERQDLPQFAAVLRGGWTTAASLTELTPTGAPLLIATLIGLAIGLGASWLLYAAPPVGLRAAPALLVWFFFATTLIFTLFARGVALTRAAHRGFHKQLDDELVIDLLRVDRLTVIGRSAARVALIWFTVSAVMFLALIGGGLTVLDIALTVGGVAIGVWVFLSTMEHVHQKILAAKAAELSGCATRSTPSVRRPRAGRSGAAAPRTARLRGPHRGGAGMAVRPDDAGPGRRVGADLDRAVVRTGRRRISGRASGPYRGLIPALRSRRSLGRDDR